MSGQEANADQVDKSAIRRAAIANPEFVDLSFAAKAATDNERSMTLLQGIKLYPKAVGWSMLLSTCIVMEGYDLVLLGRCVLDPSYTSLWSLFLLWILCIALLEVEN